jgi:uncharacterized protein YkwD
LKEMSFRRKKPKTKIYFILGFVLLSVLAFSWVMASQGVIGKTDKKDPKLLKEVKGAEDENQNEDQDININEALNEEQTEEAQAENKEGETTVNAQKPQTTPDPSTSKPTAKAPAVASAPKASPAPVRTYTAPKVNAPASNPAPAVTNGVYSLADAQNYVEGRILALVNAERASKGVGGLTSVALLAQAADIRAGEEASAASPDHTRANGTTFDTVYKQVGYTGYSAWGENLAWGNQPCFSFTAANLDALASKMFTGWKNSPGHYENMIRSSFNQTGLGVVLKVSGSQLYWTGIQVFAKK